MKTLLNLRFWNFCSTSIYFFVALVLGAVFMDGGEAAYKDHDYASSILFYGIGFTTFLLNILLHKQWFYRAS